MSDIYSSRFNPLTGECERLRDAIWVITGQVVIFRTHGGEPHKGRRQNRFLLCQPKFNSRPRKRTPLRGQITRVAIRAQLYSPVTLRLLWRSKSNHFFTFSLDIHFPSFTLWFKLEFLLAGKNENPALFFRFWLWKYFSWTKLLYFTLIPFEIPILPSKMFDLNKYERLINWKF